MQAAFAEFFDKEATVERVRAAEPLGFDPDLWAKLAATGAIAMGWPEDAGGDGASRLDLVLVAEQYGRRIAPVPFPESVAAGCLLALFALRRPSGARPPGARPPGARPPGARPPGARPHIPPSPNLGSSPLADWPLDDGERTVLASGPQAVRLYTDAVADWKLLTAAALGGLRATALELGVSYVKARKAFGVIIGSFQAVQHRLADLVVAGDGAQLLTYEAAWARDEGLPDAAALASMAFLFSADCAFRTARECLQFHGGYGVTLEYDIQLYFRRAKAWPLALGDPRREYQRLADLAYPEE